MYAVWIYPIAIAITNYYCIGVDLSGLPCGGNRMAIERLLLFGQDLQHMLQAMPNSLQKSHLQDQLHVSFHTMCEDYYIVISTASALAIGCF